jgi:hypothetical protein
MLRQGRAAFEKQLKEILLGQGIRCQRLPQEEIVRRVFENDFAISRMAELVLAVHPTGQEDGLVG